MRPSQTQTGQLAIGPFGPPLDDFAQRQANQMCGNIERELLFGVPLGPGLGAILYWTASASDPRRNCIITGNRSINGKFRKLSRKLTGAKR